MALRTFLRRLGGGPRPPEDSVVVVLPDPGMAEAARPLIERLCDGSSRLSTVVALPSADAAAALAPVLPDAVLRAPRVPPGIPPRAILAGFRARAMLLVGEGQGLTGHLARLAAGARRRGLPVFGISAGTLRRVAEGEAQAPLVALSGSAEDGLPDRAGLDALARHLIRSMGVERGDGPLIDALSRGAQGLVRGRAGPFLRGFVRPHTTLEEVRDWLGAPQTVMCLGNGPTCADPALEAMPRDALFRVNHHWMRDGYLTKADMIFAGVKRSMRAAKRTPVAVASLRKERALLSSRLLEPWHGPLGYCVVEEIAAHVVPPVTGPLRPTTGAMMIAATVALEPARMIVAGMDMFSHEDGAYAGSEQAANAYTPSHDFETDAAFIRGCLAHYRGEIVTLSPAFAALARSVPGAGFRVTEIGKT